jgi:shikimate dehydrogenase
VIDGRTRVFGILGSPVAHSLSPTMQTAAFTASGINAVYVPLPCDTSDVATLISTLASAGGGGNVTIPHKGVAATSVDQPSETVTVLGACNTFWGDEQGSLGDNTDVAGVTQALQQIGVPASAWLVVGTGGSARAVVEAAKSAGAAVAVKSRSVVKAAQFRDWITSRGLEVADTAEAEVAINATPLGMLDSDPLPVERVEVPAMRFALDLVYRSRRTPWVRTLRHDGFSAEDGRTMLVAQGAAAFEQWFPGVDAPREVMRAVVEHALR